LDLFFIILLARIANPRYRVKFTKYITNYNNEGYDTGVSAYKLFNETIIINGVTKEIKRWKKLFIKSNGHVDYLPCN
jgi:hypothetical protein